MTVAAPGKHRNVHSGDTLVIVGASARAAAQSALRAGYQPWCMDRFADRDLRAIASARRCAHYPLDILALLPEAPPGPVLLTGAMENHPAILAGIALQRKMWGAGPDAIAAVRRPGALASLARDQRRRGLRFPATRTTVPAMARLMRVLLKQSPGRTWLRKPIRSGAGHGIDFWDGAALPATHYLQRHVPGMAISSAYAADGWSCRWLGACEQIIGDPVFGAAGFQYVGNIGPLALDEGQREVLRQLGVMLTQRFDLRGVFGIDALLDRSGVIWPVEVNPRYTAGMEVLEHALGIAVLGPASKHVPRAGADMRGKAIVYARRAVVMPDLYEGFSPAQIADVPDPGERMATGDPICTMLAAGIDRAECLSRLHEGAQRLYTRLES